MHQANKMKLMLDNEVEWMQLSFADNIMRAIDKMQTDKISSYFGEKMKRNETTVLFFIL